MFLSSRCYETTLSSFTPGVSCANTMVLWEGVYLPQSLKCPKLAPINPMTAIQGAAVLNQGS